MFAGVRWVLGWLALLPALPCLANPVGPQGSTDFPVFVWRLDHPGEAMPEKLVEAFGGVNVEGAHPAPWTLEQGLDFFVGHGPGRDEMHIDTDRAWYTALWQEYWEDRDASRLVRVPCLSKAGTRAQLARTLAKTLAARDGQHGAGISLGDEVGLTPYGAPLDLCVSEACRSGFQAFVRETPRWRFLLPEEEGALPFPDTDATRKAWVKGEARHVGAWLARRAYHHQVVADVLVELASQVKAQGAQVPVGLFGQSGRSAFADVGVEQVFDRLDFMEVYRLLDSRELLYTRRQPHQRSYLTLFPEAAAPHGPAQLAFEHWLRGGDGLVLWSDRELLQRAGYFERLSNVVGTLRVLRTLWPEWQPRPAGVAILHSPDSLALSWLRDALHDGPTWMRRFPSYHNERGTREVQLRALLRLLEDSGVLPGALPIAELGPATGARFPLVVANQLLLVDEEEEASLRAHLDAGHRLLVVGEFALYNRRGERRTGDLFRELRRAFPRSVERLELDGKRYLEERSRVRPQLRHRSYPERARQALRSQLPKSAGPAWTLAVEPGPGGPPSLPWLRASQARAGEEGWLCAALPNATDEDQRSRLRALTVQLQVAEPWRVEWLHPPQALGKGRSPFVLPAGEAAVFELSRP